MGIIYCYTNKITGKKYIGQTINPEQRKRNHLHEAINNKTEYYFHRSIRKHGWENFDYEVLEETDDLSERETHYIREFNSLWPNGYNEIEVHNSMTEEIRKKISKTKQEKISKLSKEERAAMTKHMCDKNVGSKRTKETRKKQSEAMKKYLAENPRVYSEERRKKVSETMKKVRAEKNWSTKKAEK